MTTTMQPLLVRGGGGGGGGTVAAPRSRPNAASATADDVETLRRRRTVATAAVTTTAVGGVAVWWLWTRWNEISAFWTMFQASFQEWLLENLSLVKTWGWSGLLGYTLLFCLWECLGLSTVVVETVAGMAFGRQAVLYSGLGKFAGAMLAFGMGRTWLRKAVVKNLPNDNEVLALMEASMAQHPFRMALLMRFSVFPELVKNFGLAIMAPVTPGIFALVILLHGLPFTILWTLLGCDTALRLQAQAKNEIVPPNVALGWTLAAATVFAIVGSPLLVAVWIANVRRQAAATAGKDKGASLQ